MSSVRVLVTDPRQSDAAALIAELTAELSTRYPELTGDGAFKPEDVLVPRAVFVVAWLDDAPVGCGALRPMTNPDTGEIKRMYVRLAARGQGVSRSILTKLETQARQFGYRKLMLETGIRQPEAIGLYAAFGYAQIDCYKAYSDEPLSVCFEKRL